jgi:hypothetical protein
VNDGYDDMHARGLGGIRVSGGRIPQKVKP